MRKRILQEITMMFVAVVVCISLMPLVSMSTYAIVGPDGEEMTPELPPDRAFRAVERRTPYYFIPNSTGGYQIEFRKSENFLIEELNAHITIYESNERTSTGPEDDYVPWGGRTFEGTIVNKSQCFRFYARKGRYYKIELDERGYSIALGGTNGAGLTEDGFLWALEDDVYDDYPERKYAVIHGYEGEDGENVDLVVPSEISGYPVRVIDDWAISGDFNSITVSEGITEFRNVAISTGELNTLSLPKSLDSMIMNINIPADIENIVFPNGSDCYEVRDVKDHNDNDNGKIFMFSRNKCLIRAYGVKNSNYVVPDYIREIEGGCI